MNAAVLRWARLLEERQLRGLAPEFHLFQLMVCGKRLQ